MFYYEGGRALAPCSISSWNTDLLKLHEVLTIKHGLFTGAHEESTCDVIEHRMSSCQEKVDRLVRSRRY
jgi:hypothetical protein